MFPGTLFVQEVSGFGLLSGFGFGGSDSLGLQAWACVELGFGLGRFGLAPARRVWASGLQDLGFRASGFETVGGYFKASVCLRV